MKKLNKLQINAERLITNEELSILRGGYDEGYDGYPKIDACKGKQNGDICYFFDAAHNYLDGRCLAFAPNYILHCSNLL